MDQQLLVKTNSEIIMDYLTLEFGNYFCEEKSHVSGYYFPLKSQRFDKLKFPSDGKIVWDKKKGTVFYKDGKYFGIYHNGLVKGIYNSKTNTVLNLIRDPSRYFNICVGVIDYLFSKFLLHRNIFRIHAACVVRNNEGLLICGSKGAGKTTLLMKLLQSGYSFVADDSVYLQFKDNKLICYPFPKSIKISAIDTKKFPNLYQNLKYHRIITSDGLEKLIIKPQENAFPVETQRFSISQIIIPTIAPQQSCEKNIIHPTIPKTQCCAIDVIKNKLSYDLLIRSFRGDDLLNIDYLPNSTLLKAQKDLCQKVLDLYNIKIFTLGNNFEEIQIGDFLS